jgi:hypothetical protein
MAFWKDITPLLLLFVIGDSLTTIFTIGSGLGYEGNPILSSVFNTYGLNSLFFIKIGFIPVLYFVYRKAGRSYWNFTRHTVTAIGIVATANNLVLLRFLI